MSSRVPCRTLLFDISSMMILIHICVFQQKFFMFVSSKDKYCVHNVDISSIIIVSYVFVSMFDISAMIIVLHVCVFQRYISCP